LLRDTQIILDCPDVCSCQIELPPGRPGDGAFAAQSLLSTSLTGIGKNGKPLSRAPSLLKARECLPLLSTDLFCESTLGFFIFPSSHVAGAEFIADR
jgi:hypothetical protein